MPRLPGGEMIETLRTWQQHIDSRVLRERVLILLSLLAVVFMLWDFVVQAPIDKARAQIDTQLAASQQERSSIEAQITSMSLAAAASPAVVKQKQINQLQAALAQEDEKLASMSRGLISAAQLPEALEAILKRAGNLELEKIETLAAKELQLPAQLNQNQAGSTSGTPSDAATGVYQHGVILKLKGSYFELMSLLTQLENLSYKFYWESLDYRVLNYPKAEIELKVFTLSSEEGLLGV